MSEGRPVLGGRYEILEPLGYGGMAEVSRGIDTRLGREVAVKTLRADLARDPSFQARFQREAQSAASLNHPSVVAVYDTGEDASSGTSVPYIVMEYVRGRTLREVLNDEGPLAPARAMQVTGEVLRALDYSHKQGIVHRDIKPGNVMMTPSGDIKVMDFGIARALTSTEMTMTQTAAVMGTAQYLSPEQARGDHVDARSDLYSTGCLLYELLTGAPPFTGDSPVSVAYQHVQEIPTPPSQLNGSVPAEVDAVVLKAMAKNPANRYQSAGEMRSDIERWLDGHPVLAPIVLDDPATVAMARPVPAETTSLLPMSAPEEPAPGPRRRSKAALLGVVLVLAALGLAAAFFSGMFDGEPETTALPDVKNQNVDVAENRLTTLGLRVTRSARADEEVAVNLAIGTDPPAGTGVRDGSPVTLFYSTGPGEVTVPKVTGLSQDEATAALREAGLAVGSVQRVDSPGEENEVLSTDPAAGERAARGTEVALQVASGTVAAPDLRGRTVGQAREALRALDLNLVVNNEPDPTGNANPGTIFRQDPVPGSPLQPGEDTVEVSVATERPTPSPTVEPTQTKSPTPEPTATQTTEPTETTSPEAAASSAPPADAAADGVPQPTRPSLSR
ncbi:MAG: Stk1 family PASTA domain-containing Ser/Thr kinase [Actinomycetota bacterium]|nr:Stk1 family PASTA domain-containing Ser/Thr kinase [Actinomycetota bacterium]